MSSSFSIGHWHNPLAPRLPQALGWLLLAAAFAFSLILFTPLERPKAVDGVFLLLGLYAFVRYSPLPRKDAALWLIGLSVGQLTMTWLFLMADHPEFARSGPTLEDFLDKFVFLFLAIALAGQRRLVGLLLSGIGVLILIMPWTLGGGLGEFQAGLMGERVGFGLNPIRTALYFSVVILGGLAFFRVLVLQPRLSWLRFAGWLLLMVYSVLVVLMTQTRGVLVALMAMAVLMAWLVIRHGHGLGRVRPRYWVLALLVLVGVLGALSQSRFVANGIDRFAAGSDVLNAVAAGSVDEIPNTSWGLRVQFWMFGADRVGERPVAGWGYRSARHFLESEVENSPQFKGYRQLHNSYLEAAVSYGIGGALLLVAIFVWVLWRCVRSRQQARMPVDYYLFGLTSIGFVMSCSLIYGLLFSDDHGLHLYTLVMGCALSMAYRQPESDAAGLNDVAEADGSR